MREHAERKKIWGNIKNGLRKKFGFSSRTLCSSNDLWHGQAWLNDRELSVEKAQRNMDGINKKFLKYGLNSLRRYQND